MSCFSMQNYNTNTERRKNLKFWIEVVYYISLIIAIIMCFALHVANNGNERTLSIIIRVFCGAQIITLSTEIWNRHRLHDSIYNYDTNS